MVRVIAILVFLLFVVDSSASEGHSQENYLNGRIAFTTNRDGNFEIYTMNADGTDPQRLTNNPGFDMYPSWSPDGQKIVFASDRDDLRMSFDIYTMNADGSNVARLMADESDRKGRDTSPVWSPDGEKIAFTRQDQAEIDIYVVNKDGTGLTNLTSSLSERHNRLPSWSSDGTHIFFSSTADIFENSPYSTTSDIYTVHINSGSITNVRDSFIGYGSPDISPDQTKLVIDNQSDYNPNLLIIDLATDQSSLLTDDEQRDFDPKWSPDGTKIVYASILAEAGIDDIIIINADGSGQKNLTNSSEFYDRHPDWQPILVSNSLDED